MGRSNARSEREVPSGSMEPYVDSRWSRRLLFRLSVPAVLLGAAILVAALFGSLPPGAAATPVRIMAAATGSMLCVGVVLFSHMRTSVTAEGISVRFGVKRAFVPIDQVTGCVLHVEDSTVQEPRTPTRQFIPGPGACRGLVCD